MCFVCRYKQAEKRFIEALQEAVAGFPPDDPHIPSAKNNLAEFYRNIKRYDDAERLYKEVRRAWSMYVLYLHSVHSKVACNEACPRCAKGARLDPNLPPASTHQPDLL